MRREKFVLGSVIAAALLAGPAAAHPADVKGAWRLDAARCPDLVEDRRDRRESRRDERVNNGRLDRLEDRADRRESRRDERVTVCPRSAWVWTGAERNRTKRPAAVKVYYDTAARSYYRLGPNRVRIVIR